MYCLYCGECCKKMSPISNPEVCPFLVIDGTFCFCNQYNHRPKACVNYDYAIRFCPIGMSILGFTYPKDNNKIIERIDTGWEKIKSKNLTESL